jgi:tRNA threonylcarbamoyladenosine biosynthesis protein TsaB
MEYLLHIDTSTDSGTVAINCDGIILGQKINEESRNHAAGINLMIEALLADSGIAIKDLAGVVVCAGPGSYTGLRIGLATAKGFCYALDRPLILDNRLDLLANQAYQTHQKKYASYISLLIARDKEYFITIYDNYFKCTVQARHIKEEQLNELIEKEHNTYIISNAPPSIFATLNITGHFIDEHIKPDLKHWAKWAFKRYKCHEIEILSTAEPFYLKQVYTHN